MAALFLDAIFLPVRPDGPKEGVLVASGFTEQGERVLFSVMLGMRVARGLACARALSPLRCGGADGGRRVGSEA